MINSFRKKTYEILGVINPDSLLSRSVNLFLIYLIILNVAVLIVETVPGLPKNTVAILKFIDFFSVAVFTVEYFLRLWTATSNPKYPRPILGRIRYMFTPMALVDLLAILPFYLPMFLPVDLRFLRVLRLFRFFRILKIIRYSKSAQAFAYVFKEKKEQLFIVLFAILVLLLMASSLIYYFEQEAQPQYFGSIPSAFWWSVITLTTVGYGDVYPVTVMGKILGGVIAILGIGVVALPSGILAAGFAEAIQKNKKKKTCPHCGKEVEL